LKGQQAVIIGAGLGGLAAAAALAADGWDVSIYEKNEKIGGKLNIARQDGYTFDLGPSIVTMPEVFREVFRRAGRAMEDYVSLQSVDPHWRTFFPDGAQLDLNADRTVEGNEKAGLSDRDREQMERFFDYAKELYQFSNQVYFRKAADTLQDVILSYNPLRISRDADRHSVMDDGVRRYLDNRYLQDTMNFFAKYVGSSPYDAPAILNLLSYVQWEFGLWYVPGGLYGIAQGLEQLLRELRVPIHLNSEVSKIQHSEGRVSAIRLQNGQVIEADVIISNMEFIPAYRELLSEPSDVWQPLEEQFEPACSGLVLHLGVDTIYPQLAHHNFFFSSEPEKHFHTVFREGRLPRDPTIYLVAPGKSDPGLAPPDGEVIKILPHIPHLGRHRYSRQDYLQMREDVLDKLESMGLHDLRKHIVTEKMWTPRDIEQLYYTNCGAIYGVVSHRDKNLGFKGPKRSRLYDGLYFVGGSVNPGPGMPMAAMSGLQTADIIQNRLGQRGVGTY